MQKVKSPAELMTFKKFVNYVQKILMLFVIPRDTKELKARYKVYVHGIELEFRVLLLLFFLPSLKRGLEKQEN